MTKYRAVEGESKNLHSSRKLEIYEDGVNTKTHVWMIRMGGQCGACTVSSLPHKDILPDVMRAVIKFCMYDGYSRMYVSHYKKGVVQALLDMGFVLVDEFMNMRTDNYIYVLRYDLLGDTNEQ